MLDRTSRNIALTAFGRAMLPSARRLVELTEILEFEAERAKLQPFLFAVPSCSPPALARLIAEGRRHQLNLETRTGDPFQRRELVRSHEVRAALIATGADQASWRIPLGLADDLGPHTAPLYLDSLRPGRADRDARRRRIWLEPEDDVPHIRDSISRLRDALGLQPKQVSVARSLVAAVAEVFGSGDLLLCTAAQAEDLGLHWRPIGDLTLVRGYRLETEQGEDSDRILSLPHRLIGNYLGVPRYRLSRGSGVES
ncbi:LysR family transcriptional regulator [Nocardia testacea]|uniref:LysR family transcriptional regulator n=1 Tax=Nocardia testacea TaxID=248551 RepID=UPI0012F6585A|nr:LysR family transcriptional regulator [Nocardia testacea]